TGKVTLKAESEIKAGSITAKDLVAEKDLKSAGNITADKLDAKSTVELTGGVVNAKEVSLANMTTIIGGASLIADNVNGEGDINVGKDDDPNGTGSIYAKTLTSAGKIFIDPEFGQQAAFVGAEHLATDSKGIEVTTGDIVVGKNAALAVGVSSVEQARSVLSSLGLTDANGSFKQNGVKNAIYTDALVKLGTGKGLTVDSDANPATPGVITLGDKSAVVIGKNAAAKSVATGKAVLTADINGTGVTVAGKSKVIFAGNATKQDIKDVKVFGNADNGGTVISAADADKVSVQLSPLYNEAKLTVDGGITDITVNRGYINTALYNASLPVKNLVAEVADTALTGDGVGSDFIMENALVDGGANIESAARLATFGGAYQAAAAAVNTGIDAAQARLGLGIDNSAEVKGEDISVWANAVYKNTDSDSFEAQGANYGADLDLTSLVIGADYNMAEGSKVGAYATFGTGDVDGKGAGHNVKNDVDTYGFGIYGSAKLASGVSILSDVGYTVAQNEFKGIVNADADMKVFTAGANVKYTFNTQVADISPFVGARYTSFNLESYAVKSAKGIVAYTDADTAHIFSIPVGFDLSKQITAGEWNVKPAFTAKVTFNTGDKTVSSSTQFTGVKNTLNLDAEVMDDVTYSVGASVSAAKGAATFGAGLSYTGSSETNELSAQIGARYTF
uniref:autotransporter outer membrane beta-barrel domain-containing protein n=1 Tax=Succinivibrio sp. TaxID=2053619 RepID=UPI003870C067